MQFKRQNKPVPDDKRKILRRIVCVKLKDDIYCPGERNGQIIGVEGTRQSEIQTVRSDSG